MFARPTGDGSATIGRRNEQDPAADEEGGERQRPGSRLGEDREERRHRIAPRLMAPGWPSGDGLEARRELVEPLQGACTELDLLAVRAKSPSRSASWARSKWTLAYSMSAGHVGRQRRAGLGIRTAASARCRGRLGRRTSGARRGAGGGGSPPPASAATSSAERVAERRAPDDLRGEATTIRRNSGNAEPVDCR